MRKGLSSNCVQTQAPSCLYVISVVKTKVKEGPDGVGVDRRTIGEQRESHSPKKAARKWCWRQTLWHSWSFRRNQEPNSIPLPTSHFLLPLQCQVLLILTSSDNPNLSTLSSPPFLWGLLSSPSPSNSRPMQHTTGGSTQQVKQLTAQRAPPNHTFCEGSVREILSLYLHSGLLLNNLALLL